MGKRRNKSKRASNTKVRAIASSVSIQLFTPKKLDEKSATQAQAPSAAVRLAAAKKQRFMDDFAHAVAVIMRTPKLRDMPVADLEWLLLPALLAGQCRVAFSQSSEASGPIFPSALVLWARVSDAVDKRLDAGAIKLSPPIGPRGTLSG